MPDHLVYLVADLDAAIRDFSTLGLSPTPGGKHQGRGTHNALLRLGDRSYLELLAVDPATLIPAPRWMGIDEGGLPRISRWAVHAGSNIMEKAKLLGGAPEVLAGERKLPAGELLRWQLTDPGINPAVSTLPFLIAWDAGGPHPADNLPELGLTLAELEITDPNPEAVGVVLDRLGYLGKLTIKAGPANIRAKMNGPQGSFMLPGGPY